MNTTIQSNQNATKNSSTKSNSDSDSNNNGNDNGSTTTTTRRRTTISISVPVFCLTLTLCMLHNILSAREISVEIVSGCLLPDMSTFGYTPQQALNWYQAIGPPGRNFYAYRLFPIDLLIIMGYTYSLTMQLSNQQQQEQQQSSSSSSSSTWYWKQHTWSYFPIITAIFDLMESSTHAYLTSTFDEISQSESSSDSSSSTSSMVLISIASMATIGKFIFLTLSLCCCGYNFLCVT